MSFFSPYGIRGPTALSSTPGYSPAWADAAQPRDIWQELDAVMSADPINTSGGGLGGALDGIVGTLGDVAGAVGPMLGDYADATKPDLMNIPGYNAPGGAPNMGPGIYGMQALIQALTGGR